MNVEAHPPPPIAAPRRVLFVYLGRRGPLTRFSRDLGIAAQATAGVAADLCISRQNERRQDYASLGDALLTVDTFASGIGAFTGLRRFLALKKALRAHIRTRGVETVVSLMPHVWSPLLVPVVHAAGARYVSIVHDATRHPGDRTALVNRWMLREAVMADRVVTLSGAVARQLVTDQLIPAAKIVTLFHPDLELGPVAGRPTLAPLEPLRILFLGRILAYKGLPLLVEAVTRLQAEGMAVHLSVYGEGALRELAPRLAAMGAKVVNRWLSEEEIGAAVTECHAVALPYVEASQSGVAAAAFGGWRPVVATPVGGIKEQVEDGVTGIMAASVDAAAFAQAIRRLAGPGCYEALVAGVLAHRGSRSMAAFMAAVRDRVL